MALSDIELKELFENLVRSHLEGIAYADKMRARDEHCLAVDALEESGGEDQALLAAERKAFAAWLEKHDAMQKLESQRGDYKFPTQISEEDQKALLQMAAEYDKLQGPSSGEHLPLSVIVEATLLLLQAAS